MPWRHAIGWLFQLCNSKPAVSKCRTGDPFHQWFLTENLSLMEIKFCFYMNFVEVIITTCCTYKGMQFLSQSDDKTLLQNKISVESFCKLPVALEIYRYKQFLLKFNSWPPDYYKSLHMLRKYTYHEPWLSCKSMLRIISLRLISKQNGISLK